MIFFTDNSVKHPYLLIKLEDYLRIRDKDKHAFDDKKRVYVDPGVYELTKSPEYSWIDEIYMWDFLDSLPENHYFSWDYPCDMNMDYQELFIKKTWDNAKEYHTHPNYIVTCQMKYQNFESFKYQFNRFNDLDVASGIFAIGNICRFPRMNTFVRSVLTYTFQRIKHPSLHIYGLCLNAMPFASHLADNYEIEFTVDSTKWTRAVTDELKFEHGLNCKAATRQLFFDKYLERIVEKGVNLEI